MPTQDEDHQSPIRAPPVAHPHIVPGSNAADIDISPPSVKATDTVVDLSHATGALKPKGSASEVHQRQTGASFKATNTTSGPSSGSPSLKAASPSGPQRRRKAVWSLWDRLVAFLALLIAIGALYWGWRGSLSADDISLKLLLLNCRNRYEKDPSSPTAIPPECADVLSAYVKPVSQQLVERGLEQELREPSRMGSFNFVGLPDWMRARCYNGTRAMAPIYLDEATGAKVMWLESFEDCITMITIPEDFDVDNNKNMRFEQWIDNFKKEELEKMYQESDFPFLQKGRTPSETMGCENCMQLWGLP